MSASPAIPADAGHDYTPIKRKLDWWFRIYLGMFGFGLVLSFCAAHKDYSYQEDSGFIFLPAVMLSAFLIWYFVNLFPNWHYRVGWDKGRIYMRAADYVRRPWFSMAIADIAAIDTCFENNGVPKARFYAFDHILLLSKEAESSPDTNNQLIADGKMITLHPPSFDQVQLRDMLWHIHGRRPELFPQDVLDYMMSPRNL